jgi:site-specific DNA-cytosine methylase
LPGDSKKGKPKGQSAATTLTEGTGTDSGIVNAIGASIYHKSTVVNQDANAGHMIVETNPTRLLGSQIVGSLNATDYKWPQNQQLDENKFIVEPTLTFDTQFGSNANVTEDIAPTLKSSQQSPSVAYPIQDGRDMEKHQNGFGVSSDGEPSYTLDQTGAQSVAYSIREDAKANNFSATELDYANSLSALRPSPQSHHAQMFIAESTMAVRRLTPLECERLMGWPDDHTRYRADGTEQVDTHRYKQCGNGVASPVAQWIAKHILAI